MEILKNSIALLYKKKGQDVISENNLELMITMDFRWFTPKDARGLIELGKTSGLLKKHKDGLEITYDWRTQEIPIGFKPSNAVFEAAAHRSCFSAILDTIEKVVKKPRAEIVSKINKKQESLKLTIEVTGLLVGEAYSVDMSGLYEPVEKELMMRFGQ